MDAQSKRKSSITCHSCRRRKVKCDREIPYCRVCVDTGQECEYPARAMKPGPKIGSNHRQRRRYKDPAHSKAGERQSSSIAVTSPSLEDCDDDLGGPEKGSDLERASNSSHQSKVLSQRSTASRKGQQATCRRASQLNINDLSFILHPSHEASTPDKEQNETGADDEVLVHGNLYQRACYTLSIPTNTMDKIIKIYFENMVAINLFHEPTFHERIQKISSIVQLSALLASMAAYATRFLPCEKANDVEEELRIAQPEHGTPKSFLNLALQCIDQALSECNDEPPPLCILQAVIVATHCQLTQGVRGKAWRSLGLCVRLAYELNFHLMDSRYRVNKDANNTGHWCEDEEKRRAWWAIWEMDVFASTIRRTPTAINWSQMEVFLPVPDTAWYHGRPVKSCFFEGDPAQRWRALQESGNTSAKAWFIVINSLMKDAQIISCPRGVPSINTNDQHQPSGSKKEDGREYYHEDIKEARQKLEILANSVHCFVRTMPESLRYRHQYLSFNPRNPGQIESPRQLHCSIYNIYVMTQLARLMIYRYDVFGTQMQSSQSGTSGLLGRRNLTPLNDKGSPALRQYFEAADNILAIINNSCENHIQYINPFLSSTIWLAAAVQLVQEQFAGPSTKVALIKSRFDVLFLTYKQCVGFWDMQTAMQQNLEAIEVQLEGHSPAHQKPHNTSGMPNTERWQTSRNPPQFPGTTDINWPEKHSNPNKNNESDPTNRQMPTEVPPLGSSVVPVGLLPRSPPASEIGNNARIEPIPSQIEHLPKAMQTVAVGGSTHAESSLQQCSDTTFHEDGMVDMPILDFTTIADNMDDDTMTMDASSSANFLWKNFELSSDIHDLLSGFSTY